MGLSSAGGWIRRLARPTLLAVLLLFSKAMAAKPQAPQNPKPLQVGHLNADLILDGILDEADWSRADLIENLTMVEPQEGVPATVNTRVMVLADPKNILIGVVCEDAEPGGIVSYSKNRDAPLRREDHIRIVLDTFRDGRTGYIFAVNPSGARYDALVPKPGEPVNSNWDAAWEAATARTGSGWSVEIRIPVRSIVFKKGLESWGFNIERRVERLQEISRWAAAQRDIAITQTARAGLLTGLPEFDLGWGLSVRPSITAGVGSRELDGPTDTEADPSLDVTQLMGPNLLGALTVNTDFAETEVDTRQVNLTRFPLFFPEKRTFFLEGADIFDFGLGLRTDLIPFFSRRIGLQEGREVPIRFGGKVSGRAGDTNLGGLVVHTGDVEGLVPETTLSVMRLQQNVLAESTVGMIGTFGDPQGRSGAWLAGGDFTYQTSRFRGDKNLLVGVWGLAAGRDDLTSGDKTAYGFKVDYPNDIINTAFTYMRIGDSFEPSLGFVPRPGIQIFKPGLVYGPRPDWPWVRRMFHTFILRFVTDLDGEWESYTFTATPLSWLLESGDRFGFSVIPEGEKLFAPFEIAEGVLIPPGTYHWRRFKLEGELAAKRKLSGRVAWLTGGFFGGSLDQIQVEVSWKPSPLITLDFSGERDIGELPVRDFTKNLLGARLRLNISPDLTLSSFLQYDNESDSFGTNTRLRWTFHPLGDLFVIYNVNVRDLHDRLATDTNQLLVKLQYAFRR